MVLLAHTQGSAPVFCHFSLFSVAGQSAQVLHIHHVLVLSRRKIKRKLEGRRRESGEERGPNAAFMYMWYNKKEANCCQSPRWHSVLL